jgi:polyphosphate kinase
MASAAIAHTEWDADRDRGSRLLNRELSWLEFDRRVLELAADSRLPLLERVTLCSIVSSNLDEFFAVRIARLQRRIRSGDHRRSRDGATPARTFALARYAVERIQAEQEQLWREDLQPSLAASEIRVVGVDDCRPGELRELQRVFERQIQPLLTPIAVGPTARFPAVRSLALNVALFVRDESAEQRFMHLSVPAVIPRFLTVGADRVRVPIEEAIIRFMPTVLGNVETTSAAVFRVTRDAELFVPAGAESLLHAVEGEVLRRRFGDIVRLEMTTGAEAELVAILRRELQVETPQIYETDAPLGLRDLAELRQTQQPDLKYREWRPLTSRTFGRRNPAQVLAQIRERDVLVHHPYDSFETSVQAFADCARDEDVASFKATIYRTGDPSPTLLSLMQTAREEKQATALVEVKARFDERCNIAWARDLERAGVDVVYGVPNLKVHAKLALLVRHEGNGLRRYVHIGTGNYHISNASNYEDLSLFTADEEIAADVADVFDAVTAGIRPERFRKLLVGPWFLRDGLLREIARVADAARASDAARIRIKVNALLDPEIIDALYDASAAGAQIDIITRGICALRPGVPGLSERITVGSVLGRFLEHSRVMSFDVGDQTKTWIGSADLMPRNLDCRVEVLAPLEDPRLRAEVDVILDALLNDTQAAWEVDAHGQWRRRQPPPGERPFSAQEFLMARAANGV